jgi:hypothetical protein
MEKIWVYYNSDTNEIYEIYNSVEHMALQRLMQFLHMRTGAPSPIVVYLGEL